MHTLALAAALALAWFYVAIISALAFGAIVCAADRFALGGETKRSVGAQRDSSVHGGADNS